MLVLTRKAKQVVKIGDDIEVEVLILKGGSVRLGFRAPPNIRITRGELDRFGNTEETPTRPQGTESGLSRFLPMRKPIK